MIDMATKLIILCLVTLGTAQTIRKNIVLTMNEPMAHISINMNGEAYSRGIWTIHAPEADTLLVGCADVQLPPPSRKCLLNYIVIDIEGFYTDKFCSSDGLSLKFDFQEHEQLKIKFKTQVGGTGRMHCVVSSTYSNKIPCGNRNRQRIVGGEETDPNEYPWQGIFMNDGSLCGGSLIHPSWFLTAAHCIGDMESTDGMIVLMGVHNLNNNPSEESIQGFQVQEIFVHEGYDHSTNNNDIALLRLSTPADISKPEVGIICLPFGVQDNDIDGANGTVTGWGDTSYGGNSSDVLMEVVMPVLSTESCREHMGDNITDNMICTYEQGKSSCHGDSGGPLSVDFLDKTVQVGVVSFGYRCAQGNLPAVYTKLSNYLNWIRATIGSDSNVIGPN